MDLVQRWQRTWQHLDCDAAADLLDALRSAYSEPHRAYHTLQHLAECFGHLDACPQAPSDPAALELALWFHDAVYDTHAADSEARSAAWARSALSKGAAAVGAERLGRIEALILVTQHDAAPKTGDEEILLDVDLSILGADEARFAEYEQQVRVEYCWVPEDAYRSGRARILAQFAERPALYHTQYFREALETRARANLSASLDALKMEVPSA